ncbi:hypothetical protein AVEN_17266-1 [Araneus ventricosus]|uniref:Uncharacterized protein n=1 Tax=Araneus ventricosus TaxID=182803 RepID=A0A4Y2LZ51_ARAVE|nr:hypothetical protein AVEN_17266-1 [Araneus ventricosus]
MWRFINKPIHQSSLGWIFTNAPLHADSIAPRLNRSSMRESDESLSAVVWKFGFPTCLDIQALHLDYRAINAEIRWCRCVGQKEF